MRNSQINKQYRQLDRDLCSAGNFSHSGGLFIPDLSKQSSYEDKLQDIEKRIALLDNLDPVTKILSSHFADYVDAKKNELKRLYERPASYINGLMSELTRTVRNDMRPGDVKLKELLSKYKQSDKLWRGIKAWLGGVTPVYAKELYCAFDNFTNVMTKEAERLEKYFPDTSESMIFDIRKEIKQLTAKTAAWQTETKALCGDSLEITSRSIGDNDVFILEEEHYRSVLNNRGVELGEILSWFDDEVNSTREEVFEICGRIKLSDSYTKSMEAVLALLNKYAGPCKTPREMLERGKQYIKETRKAAVGYVQFPDDERCDVVEIYEQLKDSYPWGGYGGGDIKHRPLIGHMFLNNYNYKAISDGWIKTNCIHEAYPGHHVQWLRTTLDPIPQTMKEGAKNIPLLEGTAHRSERVFSFVFENDPFFALFVAYRRHHTAVRVKADLMLRYFGVPVKDVIRLYIDEVGLDHRTAFFQVNAHIMLEGYFTAYYYGMKKLAEWEKKYNFCEREYTELLFQPGNISLDNFHRFLLLTPEERRSLTNDFY